MRALFALAVLVSLPSFAAAPASVCKKGKHEMFTCSGPGVGHLTAEVSYCGNKKDTFVDIYMPGKGDKPMLAGSEVVSQRPTPKNTMGASQIYGGKTTEVSVNWTTAPDKTGGHHGSVSFGKTKNVAVVCHMAK